MSKTHPLLMGPAILAGVGGWLAYEVHVVNPPGVDDWDEMLAHGISRAIHCSLDQQQWREGWVWTVVSSIKLHVPPCRSCQGWMAAINSSHKASACSISKQGWGWGVDSWCVNKVACVDPVWSGYSFKFASTQHFEEPTTAYRTSNSANRVGVDS
jgi:hypothetical protein